MKTYVFEAFYQDETIACGCVQAEDLDAALKMVQTDVAASFSVQRGQILLNVGEPKFMQGLTSRMVENGDDMPGADASPGAGVAGAGGGSARAAFPS